MGSANIAVRELEHSELEVEDGSRRWLRENHVKLAVGQREALF